MTETVDTIHADAVKMELTITALSQKLKDSVQAGEDGRQLHSSITRQLDSLKEKIDILTRLSHLGSSEEEMTRCSNLADYHTAHLAELRVKVRQANMAARQALEKQTREELLRGNKGGLVGRQTEESMRQRLSSATDTLQEMRLLLNEQVKRSAETNQVLEGSSTKLTQTDREMKVLTGSLHIGATLIAKYGRRLICDNFLIMLGLITFFLVVFYVFLSRLRII